MSALWKYFKRVEKEKVECNICGSSLSHKGGGTSSMKHHMAGKHPFYDIGGNKSKGKVNEKSKTITMTDSGKKQSLQTSMNGT